MQAQPAAVPASIPPHHCPAALDLPVTATATSPPLPLPLASSLSSHEVVLVHPALAVLVNALHHLQQNSREGAVRWVGG